MIIQLEQVSVRRLDSYLLKDLNWSVGEGEHWAIVGLNGSGKSTLLNMINGYLWPTTGTISVLGHQFGEIDLRELRESIGWVSSALLERLYASETGEEIVLSGKYAHIGLYYEPTPADLERAQLLLAQLDCTAFAKRKFETLSQGERQRLLIARALMNSPEILILDEPCNGLDIFAREQFLATLQQLATQPDAPTLLYVTHYIEEILPAFQHTLLLRRGEIHSCGATEQVLTPANLEEFFEVSVLVEKQADRTWVKTAFAQLNTNKSRV